MEPIKVIGQILLAELGLKPDRILLENQAIPAPSDKALFIRLKYADPSTVIGAGSTPAPNEAGLREQQSVSMHHMIEIDIMSFGPEARQRKEEVLLALSSQTAERLSDENGIGIARNVGPIQNAAAAEAAAMLNRFIVTVPVFAIHNKEKQVDYFDDFTNIPEVQANA